MSDRPRDYRAEYVRRIARGLAHGLSRSQARGHPKPREAPARAPKSTAPFHRQLEEGLRAVRGGKTLTEAARDVHVSPERLRRYLGSSGMAERQGRRWVVTRPDARSRQMLLYSAGEAITVSVTPAEARVVGLYMGAVARFLETNNPAFLAPFRRQTVTDVAGKRHPFETNPNTLYRLDATGGDTFEDIYRIVV
jgi:hypothetical protein